MGWFLGVLAILVLSFILIKAADLVISTVGKISRLTHGTSLAIAALIVSVATSLPELSVGVASSLSGNPELSLGNILGANIANLSLVLGLSGFIAGVVRIKDIEFLRREAPVVLLAGLLPTILLFDRSLSRIDGLILVGVYGIYIAGFFSSKFEHIGKFHREAGWHVFLRKIEEGNRSLLVEVLCFLGGLVVMVVSAEFLVRIASNIALDLGVPIFLVGLIVLSIGTTLPEIAFSYRSIKDNAPTILFGNLLGSVVVNATLILGIVALISPIRITHRSDYLTPAIMYIVVVLIFWFLTRSKYRLDRWESGVMIIIYFIFIIFQLLSSGVIYRL